MKEFSHLAIAILLLASSVQAQEETGGNQLEEVAREMKVASDHLSKRTTNKPTQTAQDAAVAKLDALITELEEKRKRMGKGQGSNPTSPANESTIRNGPGGMGDLHGTRNEGNRWGELPAHERDRILQSLTEGFPPHYQAVLEAYYKRLAVEKRAEEAEGVVEPTTNTNSNNMPKSRESKSMPAPSKMSAPVKKTEK